jgi:predicted Zn finger-like uncharacterized protein
MNVACPTCATTYRIDPSKVPPAGVRARCQVCAAVFPISKNGTAPAPRPSTQAGAPAQRPAIPAGLRPSGMIQAPVIPPAAPPRPAAPPAPPVAAPEPPKAAPVAPPPAAPAPAPAPAPVPPPAPPVAPAPAPAPPVAAPAPFAPPKPAAPAAAPTGRPLNPFLANDPATKARRLARALVSDLVVYNTARRDTSLKSGTLKEEFAEEVRKSYEEYELQVGKELAGSTSYFNDALNEILAGGQKVY